MNNGIKPTRLYRLTGRKDFRRRIQDREEVRPPHNQRDKKDTLQLMGIIGAGVLGIAYSFGIIFPPPQKTTVIRPPVPCKVKKHKLNQDLKNPCPPEEYPELPKCKKPDEDEDDRELCKYDV